MNNIVSIKEKLDNIQRDIINLNSKAKLVCVCKKFPVEVYEVLLKLGQNNFAENYVQEAIEKRELLDKQKKSLIHWHFIGKIQSNKIKDLCKYFSVIHSLDQIKHAKKMNQVLKEENKTIDVLVHVNLAQEQQKSGIKKEDLKQFLFDLQQFEKINCIGLMTFPPYQDNPENNRKYFKALKLLLDKNKTNVRDEKRFVHLSMGVSNDYKVALAEGASFIRIGSGILGQREKLV
ncbi:MAG TPA: YggS family pyridoxal phosphate-dependent enzyme [Oligoflexia bacterium]|nr:YggS family pyridoxal phosphate-dependent enzyme [Oligoflexia bacterium]HMR23744.1 YggS family pyridoxal phosphate-dependent enzyme [Oligoflexia bacterium]